MSSSWCLQCYLFFMLTFLNIVQTVPPEYCLSPLNSSDCNLPPKQVFSYYKPGSRCELETWRGCPTLNLFANEYLCSLNCIFRMRPVEEDELLELEELEVQPLSEINEILNDLIEKPESETEYESHETDDTTDGYYEEDLTATTDGYVEEILTP